MQLHTHNQIAHVAITRHDGKGRAPDSTAYYEHARAAGQIASVHAEAALTRRFGLSWVARSSVTSSGSADRSGSIIHVRVAAAQLGVGGYGARSSRVFGTSM